MIWIFIPAMAWMRSRNARVRKKYDSVNLQPKTRTATVALRLGKRALTLYLVVAFLQYGYNITYRAYVPYDDPSGRDLLYTFSRSPHHGELLPYKISLLFVLYPFSSPSTKVVHTERRNPVAHGCVLVYCPMRIQFKKKKKTKDEEPE